MMTQTNVQAIALSHQSVTAKANSIMAALSLPGISQIVDSVDLTATVHHDSNSTTEKLQATLHVAPTTLRPVLEFLVNMLQTYLPAHVVALQGDDIVISYANP